MNIKVDWKRVLECTPCIEGNGYYTITFLFDDGQVCTYGYDNQKDFIKDCTYVKCGGKE